MKKCFVVITHVPTVAINNGFLPKILDFGYQVVLLTDKYDEHQEILEKYQNQIKLIKANVFNPLDIITKINQYHIEPVAVFSNSDHLQASTSIVAQFYQLPRKTWQSAIIAKNKSMMRQTLKEKQLSNIWHYHLSNNEDLNKIIDHIHFPIIAKPSFGVASIHVEKIKNKTELNNYCDKIWQENAETIILLEAFIEGDIFSIETLGDGKNIQVLGGFKTEITQPPYFIETGAKWLNKFDYKISDQLIKLLSALNITFGACHTEFCIINDKVEIIEINYRSVGDYKEFLLNELYGNYFETVIDLYLGKELASLNLKYPNALIEYIPATKNGFLKNMPNEEMIENEAITYHINHFKEINSQIKLNFSNKDYLSSIRLYSQNQSQDDLIQKLESLKENLRWEII